MTYFPMTGYSVGVKEVIFFNTKAGVFRKEIKRDNYDNRISL